MTRMVTVMVLPPGAAPIRTERIDGDDYRQLNRLVEGNLGTCGLPLAWRDQRYYAFCDDEALIRPDSPEINRWSMHLGHATLRGPIVIVKTDDMGETRSLSRPDVANLEMLLAQLPSREAVEAARSEVKFWKEHPTGVAIMNMETGQWE